MANTYALPQQTVDGASATDMEPVELPEALVPSPQGVVPERLRLSPALARLPVELDVAIPVRDFRMRKLLSLQPGEVVETQWESTSDLPLTAGEVQLAWSEFEVVDTRIAVRITRLA